MLGLDRAGGDVERGEQGARAAPLVLMGLAGERPAVGQLQVSLRPLQRLDAVRLGGPNPLEQSSTASTIAFSGGSR